MALVTQGGGNGVLQAMAKLVISSEELKPMAKLEPGTRGRTIPLKTNFFEVTFQNLALNIFHYDVQIIELPKKYVLSPTEKKSLKRKIFNSMMEKLPEEHQCMGYDCEKNAFTVNSLSSELLNEANDRVHNIKHDNGRKKKYKVVLNLVNHETLKKLFDAIESGESIFNTSTTSILQMLEVMFRYANFKKHIMVGLNSFLPLYDMYSQPKYIDKNLTKRCVLGFFASLRPAKWKEIPKILLNFDVTHKPFYTPIKVFEFMKKELYVDVKPNFRLEKEKLNKFRELMKNIQIKTRYNGHRATVIGVTEKSAYDIPMTWWIEKKIYFEKQLDLEIIKNRRNESMIDQVEVEGYVADYLSYKYSVKLEYRQLNCLQLHPESKKVYVPIELCDIPDGVLVKKPLSDMEKRKFLTESGGSSTIVNDRLKKTEKILKAQDYNNSNPIVKSLEMKISDMPVVTNGRVLPIPVLQMGNNDVVPYEGEWDPRKDKFFHPTNLTNWAVFNYSAVVNKDKVMMFVKKLRDMGKQRGCEMSSPMYLENSSQPNPSVDFKQLISKNKNLKKNKNLEYILVVVPKEKRKGEIYDRVKIAGDREVKILTSCVQESNINKQSGATISNVLQKINAKLGGVSTVLKENELLYVLNMENPVMFIGIDVNHPPPDDMSTPSLAAVVGSLDQHVSKYVLELRHQRNRTEILKDLQSMIRSLLLTFYHHEKLQRKPQRIIVYRDGVSESEFDKVLSNELLPIRKACESLPGNYMPGITFIILQKTTHTRLSCQNEKDGVGKAKNIPPGTVVDCDITIPWYTEFYLAAHKSDFGQSKPGRYCVLWDDNNLTMDNLQAMTYAMCHLYEPCTKTVSQPAPTYYAHHAAYRAKLYIKHLCRDDGQLPPDNVIAEAIRFGPGHPLHKTLFFL